MEETMTSGKAWPKSQLCSVVSKGAKEDPAGCGRPFDPYEKSEYVVPAGEIVPLVEALAEGPDGLSRFRRYEEDTSHVRDILVCTHGSHDACCGKFGYPAYETLRYGYEIG